MKRSDDEVSDGCFVFVTDLYQFVVVIITCSAGRRDAVDAVASCCVDNQFV